MERSPGSQGARRCRPELTLRASTRADLPALQTWARDPDVIAATGGGPSDEWIADLGRGLRPLCESLIAEVGGMPIGVLQLAACHGGEEYWQPVAPEGAWAIDIWIGSPDHRRHGYGAQMMRQAADRAFELHGATELWIDPLVSNRRAIAFYQRLGWEYVGEHRFDDDDEPCAIHRLPRPSPDGSGQTRSVRGDTDQIS